MHGIQRFDILGCPLDGISLGGALDAVRAAVSGGSQLHMVTANVDFIMMARRDAAFASELWQADLVVADGVPVLWAASLLGTPLRGRVNGTDLVLGCARISGETGAPVALIGGAKGVSARAAERMLELHPRARLLPLETPFPLRHEDSLALAGKIKDAGAKIVLVALGAPRQERWVRSYLGVSGAAAGIGIGSSFDIISGRKVRAPRVLREHGFEWLFRLLQEPGRLGRRYLLEDSPFFFHLALYLFTRKFKNSRAAR